MSYKEIWADRYHNAMEDGYSEEQAVKFAEGAVQDHNEALSELAAAHSEECHAPQPAWKVWPKRSS